MPNSGTVTAGSAALASQYNNLRDDVLNVSTGHTHTGASENGARVEGTALKATGVTDGYLLTADGSGGVAWEALAAAGADVQEFTTSGSWVKPAGKTAVYVLAIGGGGGGASGGISTTGAYGGRGGCGGAHSARWIPAASLAGTVTVTIGAGGVGGTAPAAASTTTAGVNGGFGGDTSFGTVAIGLGGIYGPFTTANDVTSNRGIAEWGVRQELNSSDVGGSAIRTTDAAGTTVVFDSNSADRYSIHLQPGRASQLFFSAIRAMNRTGGGASGGYADATALVGGAGARGFGWNGNIANGGTAGGGNATSADGIGGGGGGGGGVANGTAGNGGNGYLGGGGGGGGGAYRSAGNSRGGAGGNGGGGYIIVVSV